MARAGLKLLLAVEDTPSRRIAELMSRIWMSCLSDDTEHIEESQDKRNSIRLRQCAHDTDKEDSSNGRYSNNEICTLIKSSQIVAISSVKNETSIVFRRW